MADLDGVNLDIIEKLGWCVFLFGAAELMAEAAKTLRQQRRASRELDAPRRQALPAAPQLVDARAIVAEALAAGAAVRPALPASPWPLTWPPPDRL